MSCCENSSSCNIVDFFSKLVLCGSKLTSLSQVFVSHIKDSAYEEKEWHFKVLLDETIDHPKVKKYPLNQKNIITFLKLLLDVAADVDLDYSRLYEIYVKSLEGSANPQTYFCHFKFGEGSIVIEENNCIISQGTTGLSTWQGGKALAEWCLGSGSSLIKNRAVLELGCGVGLTALVACSSDVCSPSSYCLTDCHPAVLEAVRKNVALNSSSVSCPVTILPLDWHEIESFQGFSPDVVLAADVVFDSRDFPALCRTLCHFLKPSHVIAVLGCTIRDAETFEEFNRCLSQFGVVITSETSIEPKEFQFSIDPPIKILELKLSG